jgi:hypothetical protein
MKKSIVFSLFILLFIGGCYFDKNDEINPGAGLFIPCDTTHPVSYSHHILPILQNYCYSCHSGNTPSSGYHLDTYSDVKDQVNAQNLVNCVYHVHGYNQMPPGNFQLDSCFLKQISYWADSLGAPNN